MTAAVEALERDLGKLRTGRAAPGMLESLVVDAYGEPTPLKHVGTVTARNAQTLSVMLYDPGLKSAVSRAIVDSPLGFNPRDDGDALVVPVPEMTAETRREVAKLAGKAGDGERERERERRKGMDAIKRAGMPEDEAKRAEKALQKTHDDHVKTAGDLVAAKREPSCRADEPPPPRRKPSRRADEPRPLVASRRELARTTLATMHARS